MHREACGVQPEQGMNGAVMPDFWRSSGWHLCGRTPSGQLLVTDDLLRGWLLRPEMRPPEEACAAERALHDRLLAEPGSAVGPDSLAQLADPDARENWAVFLRFRDRLLAAPTLEQAYLGIFRTREIGLPPLFLQQLAHMILRQALDGIEDPLEARAGELFFRPQAVTIDEQTIFLGDEEMVEHAGTVELDVLGPANAHLYWARDERHDTVLDISFARPGLDAFARVVERWVRHFLGVAVRIEPVQKISDERWVWHVGLDAEASLILNDLYNGLAVEEVRLARILSLFRLDFADPADMRADLAGRPVYLALAMNANQRLRLKPQNLLVNLPLASRV
jgi:hypothetical protein